MIRLKLILFNYLLFAMLLSCSEETQYEDYGDVSQSPGGIEIVEVKEHQGGYRRKECLVCHNANLNIHRSLDSSIYDVEYLNELIRKNGGSKYCLTCHGNNGL